MGHRGRSHVPGAPGLAPTLGPLGWVSGPLLPTPQEPGEICGQAARIAALQRMRRALLQVGLMMAVQWCKLMWLIDVRHCVIAARGDSYFEQPTASGISRESPGPYDSGNGMPLRWALLLVVQLIWDFKLTHLTSSCRGGLFRRPPPGSQESPDARIQRLSLQGYVGFASGTVVYPDYTGAGTTSEGSN